MVAKYNEKNDKKKQNEGMRKNYEAKSLDETINNAMIDLSITSDKLVYNVLQNDSACFLCIGSKPFIIEAYSKDDKEAVYKDKKMINL